MTKEKNRRCKANNLILYRKVIFILLMMATSVTIAIEPKKKPIEKRKSLEKSILCDSTKSQLVRVGSGRITILNFPLTPKEVLPGEQVFDFKQIKNDLAIKALRSGARTNVAIYLADRRCSFELVTVSSGGDDILFVKDPKDEHVEVKFHE